MFYCDACRRRNRWPESGIKSKGRCEVCEEIAVCYDTPSSQLPAPKR